MLGRRGFLILLGGAAAARPNPAWADDAPEHRFVTEAFRMRAAAIASGDQAFGAVVVRRAAVIGYGPSRVVTDADPDAHAERVAIRDAQRRLGARDLSGAVLYSTSIPCPACQRAARSANIARMYYGPVPTDGGPPAAQDGGR